VLQVDSGKEQVRIRGHEKRVTSLTFSPDSALLASASADLNGVVNVWDVAKDKLMFASNKANANGQRPKHAITSIAFGGMGTKLATSSSDGRTFFWDIKKRMLTHVLKPEKALYIRGSLSPNLEAIADMRIGKINEIKIWALDSSKKPISLIGHQAALLRVCWSPDSRWLASGSEDKTVRVWDTQTGAVLRTYMMGNWVPSLAYSPDGKWLAAGCGRTVTIWEAASGREVLRLTGHMSTAGHVAFGPKAEILAVTCSKFLSVWQLSLENLPKEGLPITVEAKLPAEKK
jgi:WD40 repeat protein